MHLNPLFLTFTVIPAATLAQVVGTPYGFATGVTGGGDATPATPSDIAQLKEWLSDDIPRVIMIDKTFDFVGSEGTATGTACRPTGTSACTGGYKKQDWIQETCESYQEQYTASWDKAGDEGIDVGSDKSIVGVGDKGVFNGKGLILQSGSNNIIIQNIHITNLNPKFVWGGDAININGNDGVWIDHCKFSKVGRQMIVTHYEASRVTISNNEFDGVTDYSSTCNNQHYWAVMMYGDDVRVTFDKNHLHHVSGRSPKIGGSGTQLVQASNNYFASCAGHNFELAEGASVLIEGNRFENVDRPVDSNPGGTAFTVPNADTAATCSSHLGRSCQANALSGSGNFPALTDTAPLQALAEYADYLVTPIAYGKVKSTVTANAGIGKIGN